MKTYVAPGYVLTATLKGTLRKVIVLMEPRPVLLPASESLPAMWSWKPKEDSTPWFWSPDEPPSNGGVLHDSPCHLGDRVALLEDWRVWCIKVCPETGPPGIEIKFRDGTICFHAHGTCPAVAHRGGEWQAASIMPPEFARVALVIEAVGEPKRLSEIDSPTWCSAGFQKVYVQLGDPSVGDEWDKSYPAHAWASKPWVWVYDVKVERRS